MTDSNERKEKLLREAADTGNLEKLEKLLIEKVSPNNFKAGTDGPLHLASWRGREDAVLLLLQYGANVHAKGVGDCTPMDLAIQREHHAVIKLLLSHGADPNSKDRSGFGNTLLQYAAESGDQELVAHVMKTAVEKIETGTTVLAARKGDLTTLKTLIDLGIDVDDRAHDRKETAAMIAAGFGKMEVLRYLIARGADINAQDNRGNTPLMYAAAENEVEALRILIDSGANIHLTNNLNWNALMQAVFTGREQATRILLEAGSSVTEIDDEKGASVLWLGKHSGNKQIVELLEKFGAKERTIRQREKNAPYFSILDCDICAYLPHKTELTHDYKPEEIPGLETIYLGGSVEYKADETEMIKKCIHCGTYYRHYHYIDTEDSIGGAGPICSHYFLRYNLIVLRDVLTRLEKKDELAELAKRYPEIIQTFLQRLNAGSKFRPYVQPFVVESLNDYFLLKNDLQSLETNLLKNPDPAISTAAEKDLQSICEARDQEDFPSYYTRNCASEVKKMALSMMNSKWPSSR